VGGTQGSIVASVSKAAYLATLTSVLGLCVVFPAVSLARLAFLRYERVTASYSYEAIDFNELLAVLMGPDLEQLKGLALLSILASSATLLAAFFLFAIFSALRDRVGLEALVALSTAGFFMPVIVKAYAVSEFLPPSTNLFILFTMATLVVLFLTPMLIMLKNIPSTTIQASHEYFPLFDRVLFLTRNISGALVLGYLCSISLVFYSGVELRQLTPSLIPLSDVFVPMLGSRDRELGIIATFVLFISLLLTLFSSVLASKVWPSRTK
jgi:hypothetical protein